MSNITLKNIYKSFDETLILENINLQVEEGRVTSLLGPSGCGKTTILKIISGMIAPDSGQVLLSGENINKLNIEGRGTVVVFQDYLLFPHLNVEENIGFGLKMIKRSKKEIRSKVRELLDLVQLKGYEKRYPRELSGGQKQRIALARALAIEPKVLLLDEPFSNLDASLREEVRELTLDIQKKLSITTILVTHDIREALMYSDKIAVLLNGRIKQFGSPEEIYKFPNSLEVASFMGNNNYIEGRIENGIFTSDLIDLKTDKDDSDLARVLIKPESIKVNEEGSIKGIVSSKKYAGDRVYYEVLSRGTRIKLVSNNFFDYNLEDEIFFDIDKNDIIIFEE